VERVAHRFRPGAGPRLDAEVRGSDQGRVRGVDLAVAVVVHAVADLRARRIHGARVLAPVRLIAVVVGEARVAGAHRADARGAAVHAGVGEVARGAARAAVQRIRLLVEPVVDHAVAVVVLVVTDLELHAAAALTHLLAGDADRRARRAHALADAAGTIV